MTEERPDDAHEPDQTAGPADGDDGLEARRGSAPDAPFHGLRSAADIFGAPRGADDWPSRRERREAEKSARETGAPLPEPFEPVTAEEPEVRATPSSADEDDATQAISMPEQLEAPSENPQAEAEHERATLSDRIPAAAPVPPPSTAPHPSSISLPTARSHRDERAAENRAIDEERRRTDPFGAGREDVDWLGRATGPRTAVPAEPTAAPAVPAAPVVPRPLGVENVLPATDEPPSFTELLRTAGGDVEGTAGDERPFDWAIRDDEPGEVPATLTTNALDTTALAGGRWSLADESDESDDDVVAGELPTPVDGTPVLGAAAAAPTVAPAPAPAPPPALGPSAPVVPGHLDDRTDGSEDDPRLPSDAPTTALPVAGTPWWAEPDGTVPPTAAPPLVEPATSEPEPAAYPAHLPPAVGQDLDAVMGIRGHEPTAHADDAAPLPAAAPDDLDQSEWDGRETSDTSAIKDLFGTEAVGQLGGTGYDPHDTGTRMMPAVGATPAHAAGPGRTPVAPAAAAAASSGGGDGGGDRDNFINEGFAKLRNEGRRGKLLLVWGSIALIVVLLVAVFALTTWILGNSIEERTPAPTSTSAASASSTPKAASSSPASAAPSSNTLQTLQFATTPAGPGEHAWTDLAGGECLSPFTNAWAQTYTVVDCQSPHLAQLTARLQVSANQWPGPDDLASQAAERCQTSEALDTAAAAAYGDVQVQGSYAPDQATWDQGDTFISCFVTRSSGGTMTGSVAPNA
ncbi:MULTISPECIES: septum formation family protein [unclassified Curtobacterium]|uniref:septum formation family protein n=1 Tax=unclassified Curtobacterium TaxID=257496 RepID=UPI003A80E2D1